MAVLLTAVLAALAPAGASAFEKAVWGPMTFDGINQFPLYHSLGAKIYQTELNWNTVAVRKPLKPDLPTDRAYHWPKMLTQEITAAKRSPLSPLSSGELMPTHSP